MIINIYCVYILKMDVTMILEMDEYGMNMVQFGSSCSSEKVWYVHVPAVWFQLLRSPKIGKM